MLRTVSFALLALLVLPQAGALSGAPTSIAIGPEGIVDPTHDPYFLWATIMSPEVHDEAGAEDDCGAGTPRRSDPVATAMGLAMPIAAWDPTEYLSLHDIFPQCIATQVSAPCPTGACAPPLPGRAYAAYDVGTGRFYAEAAVDTGSALPSLPIGMTLGLTETQNAEQEIAVGGNSGVGLLADCEACPTPP